MMFQRAKSERRDAKSEKRGATVAARFAPRSLLLALPLAFLALFYAWPLIAILTRSLAPGGVPDVGPALAVLERASTWRIVGFTLGQAVLSTIATVIVGLPGAYLIGRYDFPGKRWLRALSGVPFVLPTLVVGAGFSALLGDRGVVNQALMNIFGLTTPPVQVLGSLGAIVLGHVFYNTTLVIRMVGDTWARLDPRPLAAARTLGASPARAFREVTLPLLAPSLMTAALLVFTFDVASFGVILVLGGPQFATLETEIYRQAINLFNLPGAAVLTLVQLVLTLSLAIAYNQLATFAARSGLNAGSSGSRPRLRPLRGPIAWAVLVATLIVVVGLMGAPLLALVGRSFVGPDGFTLASYAELFVNRRASAFYVAPAQALLNSLGVASVTAVIALAMGLPTAYVISRAGRAAQALDAALLLPLGTSAVSLGLGYLLAFDRPPVAWRTEAWLLPIAHALIAFPFTVRSLLPAWRAIRPRLRQAAAVLGASPATVVREIDLPLISRAVIVAAAFSFAISLGEFGATALLTRPGFPTVPVAIYTYLGQPGALNYGQALAMSTILMTVCAAAIAVIEGLDETVDGRPQTADTPTP